MVLVGRAMVLVGLPMVPARTTRATVPAVRRTARRAPAADRAGAAGIRRAAAADQAETAGIRRAAAADQAETVGIRRVPAADQVGAVGVRAVPRAKGAIRRPAGRKNREWVLRAVPARRGTDS
ncbi:hypothetical protein GCM10029978_005270 [Actinoallomurus acanthiterrae]